MDLGNLRKELDLAIKKLSANLTTKQQVEMSTLKNKLNNVFTNIDLINPNMDDLKKKQTDIENLVKTITDGINDNK
jgi:hypothetical protein